MFWVRIRLGGREYLRVLDTGATISIVAKKILPCGSLKNTMTTAAIRMGYGHVVHSCGDHEVEVPMGSRTIAHRFYVTRSRGGPGHGMLRWTRTSEQAGKALRSQGHHCACVM